MLRPPTGCSTFMVLDLIRVPPPAASTITVSPWVGSVVTPILPITGRPTLGRGAVPRPGHLRRILMVKVFSSVFLFPT